MVYMVRQAHHDMDMENLKQFLTQQFQARRQFIIYSIIGICGVSVDYGIFFVLHNFFNFDAQLANLVSTPIAITNNFIWNVIFNFKTKDKLVQRYLSFFAVGMVGLVITAVIIEAFVNRAGINANIVKAGSIVVVVLVQYNLNRRITFKKSDLVLATE